MKKENKSGKEDAKDYAQDYGERDFPLRNRALSEPAAWAFQVLVRSLLHSSANGCPVQFADYEDDYEKEEKAAPKKEEAVAKKEEQVPTKAAPTKDSGAKDSAADYDYGEYLQPGVCQHVLLPCHLK